MVDIERVKLPGVGVLHRFRSSDGGSVEVVSHRSGYSDLCVGLSEGDQRVQVRLDSIEAHSLAELLGGTQVTETVAGLNTIPGLAIDWYKVDYSDYIAGKFLDDPRNIGVGGLVIVALIREGNAEPVPSGRFQIFPQDTLVLAGEPQKVAKSFKYFHTGEIPSSLKEEWES